MSESTKCYYCGAPADHCGAGEAEDFQRDPDVFIKLVNQAGLQKRELASLRSQLAEKDKRIAELEEEKLESLARLFEEMQADINSLASRLAGVADTKSDLRKERRLLRAQLAEQTARMAELEAVTRRFAFAVTTYAPDGEAATVAVPASTIRRARELLAEAGIIDAPPGMYGGLLDRAAEMVGKPE